MLARIAIAAILLPGSTYAIFGWFDSDIKIEIEGHRWERSVVQEKFQAKPSSDWCDKKQKGAYEIRYTRKVKSTKKVEERTAADGKKYTLQAFEEYYGVGDKRVANDGTAYSWAEFKEFYTDKAEESWALAEHPPPNPEAKKKVQDAWDKATRACKGDDCPLTGTETTYGDWCEYKVDIWGHYRDAKSKGSDVDPYWPETEASACKEIGCIREGAKTELYFVDLSEVDIKTNKKSGKTYCGAVAHGGWSVEQWRGLKVGYQSDAKRRPAYGLLCGSIKIPAAMSAEKRLANDGRAYTKSEFVAFYGEAKGIADWNAGKVAKDEL